MNIKVNNTFEIPVLVGRSELMISANPEGSSENWYINDHCIFYDNNGLLHWIGINNPYPKDKSQLYSIHPYLGHAICKGDIKEWKRIGFALDDSKGVSYLGAPFVTWHEETQKYIMIFESIIDGRRAMEMAESQDGMNWERQGKSIITDLGYTKRDPFIIKGDDGLYRIYLANPRKEGSSISVTKTKDFKTFSSSKICLSIDDDVSWSGIESPSVVYRNSKYYLFFTYAHRHYYETVVIVSDKPDQFSMKNQITTIHGHASKIFYFKGKQYITSCGPEDDQVLNTHGVYVSELRWFESEMEDYLF